MPAVTEISLAYNTIYAVDDGAERVLIDTGPDYHGAREAIDRALVGRLPGQVIATHGHLDHAGLAHWWQQRGVPVALGAADSHLAGRRQFEDEAEFAAFVRFVEECGAPLDARAEALAALDQRRQWALRLSRGAGYPPGGRGARWPTGLRYEPFTPDVQLRTEEQPVGGTGLRMWLCPGHTPGNLVLVHEGEGWLFSGDQLLPELTPTPAIQAAPGATGGPDWRFHSLPPFVAALHRLRTAGFTRCFPGHGRPFDHVDRVIDASLGMIEERSERLMAELVAHGPGSLFALAERLYPRAVRRRFWQIVATIQGHLDLLEAEGRVTQRARDYVSVERG